MSSASEDEVSGVSFDEGSNDIDADSEDDAYVAGGEQEIYSDSNQSSDDDDQESSDDNLDAIYGGDGDDDYDDPVAKTKNKKISKKKSSNAKNKTQALNIVGGVDDDETFYGKMQWRRVDDSDRVSEPYLTYYEIVRILGERSQQLNFGATPLIKGTEKLTNTRIAYMELKLKMTPYIIQRRLPGKLYEEWKIEELEMVHDIGDPVYVPPIGIIENVKNSNNID